MPQAKSLIIATAAIDTVKRAIQPVIAAARQSAVTVRCLAIVTAAVVVAVVWAVLS